MSHAKFRRPDGGEGSYAQWASEKASRWAALSDEERRASEITARQRFTAQIKAQADGEPTLMYIYDEIGWFGVSASDVVEALQKVSGEVEVHINSPGGSVFDGLAIYAALRHHPADVSVVVDGLAASAASFIAQAATPGKLAMTPNGTMMIHEAYGGCVGNSEDMAQMAEILDQASNNVASIYADRSGRPVADMRALMQSETWVVGQEAVDLGLADAVRKPPGGKQGDPPATAAASPWQVTILAAAPSADGCCDKCGPECACAEPASNRQVGNAAVDESSWDGGKAMSDAASSDDPAAAYAGICAGRRSGDPDKQASWALPHHKHKGDPPNRGGVNNAVSRLPQTQGLTNEAAARAHLEAHQKAMGTDNHADMPAWLRDA